MPLTPTEIQELRAARRALEQPGLAIKLGSAVGAPIEKAIQAAMGRLSPEWSRAIGDASRATIEKCLDVAIRTMDPARTDPPWDRLHKVAVMTSGAAGGAFGLSALAVELPVSTTIMLRSIADIARSQGEDLSSPAARLQCLQVLALGGRSPADDAAEEGYFAARAGLARAVGEAAAYIGKHGAADRSAPAIVRLVTQVAARFSIPVSQKTAAQAVPLVGAFGGAMVNALFIDHFQTMARGHFTVRRLERLHGAEPVRLAWEADGTDPPDEARE